MKGLYRTLVPLTILTILASCTPKNENTITPTLENTPTPIVEVVEEVDEIVEEPTLTPTPTPTIIPSITPTLIPEIVGEVRTGDGPSDLRFLDTIVLNDKPVNVYFSEIGIRDTSLKQTMYENGDEWYNLTTIDGAVIEFVKQDSTYDLNLSNDLSSLFEKIQNFYKDASFNQVDVGGIYTSKKYNNTNGGVLCHDEDGSIGDYAACLAETIDGDIVILLSRIVQPYVPPTTDGGGDNPPTCPANRVIPPADGGGCCPVDTTWNGNDCGGEIGQEEGAFILPSDNEPSKYIAIFISEKLLNELYKS